MSKLKGCGISVRDQIANLKTNEDGWYKANEDGWYNGKYKAPEHETLDWFLENWELYCEGSVPTPYMYPLAYGEEVGGVQCEWPLPGHTEAHLTFTGDSKIGQFYFFHLDDDAGDRDIDIDEKWDFGGELGFMAWAKLTAFFVDMEIANGAS